MIVRPMVVELVRLPDVPVTVTVAAPVVAVALAVIVSRLVPVVEFVAKFAVTPTGRPDAARDTLPVNPFAPAIVRVSVTLLPWVTESAATAGDSVKLGAEVTAKLCCTCGAAE